MEMDAELTALDKREEEHPKAACTLMASKRYGRYLSTDRHGRPKLDAAKVKAAGKFDGKFVVITNDDTLSAEDVALAYKAGDFPVADAQRAGGEAIGDQLPFAGLVEVSTAKPTVHDGQPRLRPEIELD